MIDRGGSPSGWDGWLRLGLILAGAILVAVLPLASRGFLFRTVGIFLTFALMAQAWAWIARYTGCADLGSSGLYGVGAFVVALLSARLGAGFWLALTAGALTAAVLAGLLGLAALRLRARAFPVVTLGLPLALNELALKWPATAGGISLPVSPAPAALYELALVALLTLLVLAWRAERLDQDEEPPNGRGLAGLLLSERLLRGRRYWRGLLIYAGAGLVFGLSGAIAAGRLPFVEPGSFFDTGVTLEIVAMALIGGATPGLGPLFGAAAMTVVSEALGSYAPTWHAALVGGVILAASIALASWHWTPQRLAGHSRWRRLLVRYLP